MLDFKNKKVLVMGLGLYQEGSGISATRFLLSKGAKVTVTDLKTKKELARQIERLGQSAKKIKFVLDRHHDEDFKKADLIIKNPGVPRTSKYLAIARANNIPVETDISLFFKLVNRKQIIGITGTRGKSTTTTLIYKILLSAGQKAIIGGNIKKSPLTQLNKMSAKGGSHARGRQGASGGKNDSWAVLELSSWLLESLEDAKLSPHLAVFTNIYPDHLNTYRDLDDYAAAKENIFQWQNPQDYVVLNFDNKYTRAMGRRVPSKRFWFSLKEFSEENGCFVKNNNIYFRLDGQEEKILSLSDIKIIGEHNVANVLAAVCAGKILGLNNQKIRKAVRSFKGVPDRLEFLRDIRGVKYYNDTTSTTPEATIAALRALSQKHKNTPVVEQSSLQGKAKAQKHIILIAGGADKGLDFRTLTKEIKKTCKSLVLLKGTGTERIKKLLEIRNKKLEIKEAFSIVEAVNLAGSLAKSEDIIILSPACASFGMFINEFDRGDQFKKIIRQLK